MIDIFIYILSTNKWAYRKLRLDFLSHDWSIRLEWHFINISAEFRETLIILWGVSLLSPILNVSFTVLSTAECGASKLSV